MSPPGATLPAVSGHSHLAAIVEAAELEAEVEARRADLEAGLVPPDVRRALFTHELAARTSFAGIEDDVAEAAAAIVRRVVADRAAMVTLVLADLRRVALQPSPGSRIAAIAARLLDIDGPDGLGSVDGARRLLEEAERRHRGLLERALGRGAARVLGEAAAQGLAVLDDLEPKVTDAQRDQLGLLARRVAQAPHVDLLRALRDRAIELEKDLVHPEDFIDRLAEHARSLSEAPLGDVARSAATQADTIGRAAGAAGLPAPKAIYASELLDRNTCGPCSLVDGKSYADLAAARLDYPHGTYVHCDGGLRCRGTLVFVWGSEADATLPEPGDTPAPAPAPDVDGFVDPADRVAMPARGARPDIEVMVRRAGDVLAIIGGLHRLPARAGRIPLRVDPNLRARLGAEGATGFRGGRATDITVAPDAKGPELTVAHEFGHYVDAEAVGALGSDASMVDPLLDAWRTAIEASAGVRRLRELAASRPEGDRLRQALEGYLLAPYEFWARSYSQWVAVRGGDVAMRAQVRARASADIADQWDDDDFEPIARAIDQLMADVGLAR